jgi:hypothetical protein
MLEWFNADAAFAWRLKRDKACGSPARSSGRNFRATNPAQLRVFSLVGNKKGRQNRGH